MPQPSFLLIMTDTQGANIVGAYGHPELATPNIDRLARQGVTFDRAYTTCPLCTPARAALLTGVYAHTAGPWTNNLALGTNLVTLGQRLHDAGYQTAYSGKWHLDGHDYFGAGVCPDGWDPAYWYDGKNYLSELSEDEITLWRKGLGTPELLRAHNIRSEFTWAHRVSDRAIDFLSRPQQQPFLFVASYDEPHHPFTCPPEYAERFLNYEYPIGPAADDTLQNKPAHQREWADSLRLQAADRRVRWPMYFGCNSFVDAEIGRVLAAAQAQTSGPLYIIFTSDHGDMLGAHRLSGKGPVMYEEITHIPLIIVQPGGAGAGVRNATPVSHIDLAPTILELAGLPLPPILEGRSLTPFIAGQVEPDRSVFIEFNRYEIEHDSWGGFQPVRSIVRGQHKLVINLLHTDELYDLAADPAEMNNLIDDPACAERRADLHDALLQWMYEKRDPFRGPAWERRPWRSERRLHWRGLFRPRPADGYAPEVRDYDTGLPTAGVKTEHGAPQARANAL